MSRDIFQRLFLNFYSKKSLEKFFLNFYSIVKLSTFLDKIAVSILTTITGIELDQYQEKLVLKEVWQKNWYDFTPI